MQVGVKQKVKRITHLQYTRTSGPQKMGTWSTFGIAEIQKMNLEINVPFSKLIHKSLKCTHISLRYHLLHHLNYARKWMTRCANTKTKSFKMNHISFSRNWFWIHQSDDLKTPMSKARDQRTSPSQLRYLKKLSFRTSNFLETRLRVQ